MTEFGASPRIYARLEAARREHRRKQLGYTRTSIVAIAIFCASTGWLFGRWFALPHPGSIVAIAILVAAIAVALTAGACRIAAWIGE